MRQGVAQRQFALRLTAHDATNHFYTCLIVEHQTGLVCRDVIGLQRVGVVVVLMIEAVAPELVVVLHGLDFGITLQDAEGELTFVVGGHQAGSIAHVVVVHLERYALHGDAGAVVLYVAGNLDARSHFHHHVLHHILAGLRAQGDSYILGTSTAGQRVVGLLLVLIG